MKQAIAALLTVLCLGSASASAAELAGLGAISFPTSQTGPAQDRFLRGVTILHSFGWKQARAEFQAAQEIDPDFAMAYWGESLCYNHPLIGEQDRETPQAILRRLGETRQARLAKAPTAREKGFLAAVDTLFFGEGDTATRRHAYMEEMRSLHEAYPGDDEVAAFYALSLLMAAGAADDPQRSNVLAGAIALQLLDRNRQHPGAAHYAIHAFDDPVHAPLALPAAHLFADIAEKVSHARHMPSHIFIQRGMWDRVSASNQSAYEAAVDLWEPGDSLGDMVHSLDWGQYGDLQRGDYERAEPLDRTHARHRRRARRGAAIRAGHAAAGAGAHGDRARGMAARAGDGRVAADGVARHRPRRRADRRSRARRRGPRSCSRLPPKPRVAETRTAPTMPATAGPCRSWRRK